MSYGIFLIGIVLIMSVNLFDAREFEKQRHDYAVKLCKCPMMFTVILSMAAAYISGYFMGGLLL